MKLIRIICLSFILGLSVCAYPKTYLSDNLIFLEANTVESKNIRLLQKKYNNTDIKAILKIDKEYPVAQTQDNDFYLNHNYYRNYDVIGSIFLDYRANLEESDKLLIYGHSSNMVDVDFNVLENYYDKNYYENNKYISLETLNNIYTYEIFSVYIETSDFTYMNMNFDNEEDYFMHITKLKDKSLYPTNVNLNGNDDILILQTCSNHKDYQKYSKKYLLVIARRVLNEK